LVVDFYGTPGKHVVVVLGADGFMQIVFLADGQSVEDVFGLPVAGGPVEAQALLDHFVEATADLLEGGVVVVDVGVEDVHVFDLQT